MTVRYIIAADVDCAVDIEKVVISLVDSAIVFICARGWLTRLRAGNL